MINHYFNIFFVEIQRKEKNLKYLLGTKVLIPKPVNQSPKQPEYVAGIFVLYIVLALYIVYSVFSKENRSFKGDHQQIIFEFFNRICLLIFPSTFSPYKFPF